jgi:hypothetical protein
MVAGRRWIAILFLAALLPPLHGLAGEELAVDFSKTNGVLRALHGVNLGPLCYRGMVDLSGYHRALNPPLTRLHDVVWVHADAVDISTIFRDFRDDPAAPESYDFAATDDYLAAVVRVGSPILYRLGESIEHTPRKYRVHPPPDFARWAEVCCQIIRHYNEGWANGFHHQIRYWEIWNEPENQPAMWTGTDEQFLELYEITARAIKHQWPDLKVGGPAVGDTGQFDAGQFKPGGFLARFLRRCRERRVPLDFLSWHRYTDEPADFARRAQALRQVLDEHGFTTTESHLNEWNYLPGEDWRPMLREGQGLVREAWSAELRGPKGAAFAAWALISLQDAPIAMANFYTAEIQAFGLFNFHGVPQKTYYAFQAFRDLLDTPRRVLTPPCVAGQVAACAGRDASGSHAAVLLSNFHTTRGLPDLTIRQLPWSGPAGFELRIIDGTHNGELTRAGTLGPEARLALSEYLGPVVAWVKLFPVPAPGP